jgi:hypothetical protein
MLSQSKMPNFKKGDLVMSTAALAVARTARTKPGAAIQDPNNPQLFSFQSIPINSAPVEGLLIQAGVVFEIDAVLPWDATVEYPPKRYRLVLNPYHWSQLDEQQRQLSEAEFSSQNIILGEKDTQLPFYTYADDADLALVSAIDGRTPGESLVEAWTADEDFPWTVRLHFPVAEEVLRYDIQAWLSDNDDSNSTDDAWNFLLWLCPLYVSKPDEEALLTLEATPGTWGDVEQPIIHFQAHGKAQCILDLAEQTIDIVIRFTILTDLEQHRWEFSEDIRSYGSPY